VNDGREPSHIDATSTKRKILGLAADGGQPLSLDTRGRLEAHRLGWLYRYDPTFPPRRPGGGEDPGAGTGIKPWSVSGRVADERSVCRCRPAVRRLGAGPLRSRNLGGHNA
jgi:hypothetical protein